MITTFYPPYNFGGDGIYVQRLCNELARRGHHVEVIHCVDAYRLLARHEPANSYEDHPNVTVHGLKSPFGSLSPFATQQTGLPFFKSQRLREILNKALTSFTITIFLWSADQRSWSTGSLHGLLAAELGQDKIDRSDPDYEVLVTQ